MARDPTPNETSAWASNPAFKKAYEDAKKLKSKPDQEELLDMYAFHKIGCNEDIEADKPGTFDFKGKFMRTHWQKVLQETGATPEQAQERYIALIEQLKEKYGFEG